MLACLPAAIYRETQSGTVLVDADRCINCASCAMACPYGVIRYHPVWDGPPEKTVAVKCDNCLARQAQGLVPACVEICKSGALTFEIARPGGAPAHRRSGPQRFERRHLSASGPGICPARSPQTGLLPDPYGELKRRWPRGGTVKSKTWIAVKAETDTAGLSKKEGGMP